MITWRSWERAASVLAIGAVIGAVALCVANSDDESPEVACPTPEERAYFEEVGQVSQAIGNALQEHADRLGMVVRNESLVFDPNWQADTVEAMVAVRRIIKNFKDNVYAPVSALDIHVDFTTGVDKLDEAMIRGTWGIQEISVYEMEVSNKLVEEGTPWIASATRKTLAFCQ